jgi:hypothetical protein
MPFAAEYVGFLGSFFIRHTRLLDTPYANTKLNHRCSFVVLQVKINDGSQQADGSVVATDIIIADLDWPGSQPGSLRGIALDERNNRLYITDYGEQLLENNLQVSCVVSHMLFKSLLGCQ